MLTDFRIHPSLAAADIPSARSWYAEKLGLEPIRAWDGLLLYQVGATNFTVYATPSAGTARNTVAVWLVAHLRAEVERLRARGLAFEDLDLGPDDRTVEGILTHVDDEGTTLSAWFRDVDGNWVTMVEQPPESGAEAGIAPMLAAADLRRARAWYSERLGLEPFRAYEDELLVYRSGLTHFSIYATPSAGSAKNTVALWRVADLRAEVAVLRARGVRFEDVDFGDARTVDGVMTGPDDGSLNAWFTDSEGNILGLAEDHDDPLP